MKVAMTSYVTLLFCNTPSYTYGTRNEVDMTSHVTLSFSNSPRLYNGEKNDSWHDLTFNTIVL